MGTFFLPAYHFIKRKYLNYFGERKEEVAGGMNGGSGGKVQRRAADDVTLAQWALVCPPRTTRVHTWLTPDS